MIVCEHCDYQHEKLECIARHMSRMHEVSPRKFYTDLYHDGIEPTCACGCGEPLKFLGVNKGFAKWRRGHINRVRNNWGHNPKVREKNQDLFGERRRSGEIPTWCKGLTKETDERVAAYGKKGSKTIRNNPKEIKRRQDVMRENRLNGTIRTLYGPEHPQWKGGTSEIRELVYGRADYKWKWRFSKLKAADFKCVRCGSNDDIQVHHDKKHMAEIIHEVIDNEDYDKMKDDWQEKNRIADLVVEYHIKNDVSGETICKECHQDEHPSYNL